LRGHFRQNRNHAGDAAPIRRSGDPGRLGASFGRGEPVAARASRAICVRRA
jgi:hypothetical protein